MAKASQLVDDDLWRFREHVFRFLSQYPIEPLRLCADLWAHVEAAGRESTARRDRLRAALGFALEFFRELIRTCTDAPRAADKVTSDAIDKAIRHWGPAAKFATACAARTLDALEQVDRNAHLLTLIDAWCKDLPPTQRGRYGRRGRAGGLGTTIA